MTLPEVTALIVAAASLLTAVGTLAVSIATALRLSGIHAAVNGQSAALNQLTAKASFAEGVQAALVAPPVGNLPTTEAEISPQQSPEEHPTRTPPDGA